MRAAVVLLLAAGALAACGDSDDSSAPSAAPTASGATTQSTATGVGAKLDKKQASAALLTVADLPAGWTATKYVPSDDSDSDSDSGMKFAPAECDTLFKSLSDEPDTVVHESGAKFTKGGEQGTQLTTEIATHSDLFEKAKFDSQFTKVLDTCSSMTADVSGQQAQVKLKELDVPQLGDYSKGVRMEISVAGVTMTGDLVQVAAGHNALSFNAVGMASIDSKDLDAIVRKGFANLEKATA